MMNFEDIVLSEVSQKEQMLCGPICMVPAPELNVVKLERGVFLILVGSKGLDTFSYLLMSLGESFDFVFFHCKM